MVESHADSAVPEPQILRPIKTQEFDESDDMAAPYPDEPAGLADELRQAAEQLLDEQKVKAADAARGIAQAIRQAAGQLSETAAAPLGRYALQTATNVERLSDRVREEPLAELLADAEAAARRQPELFFLGAAAAGFMIGRFLKASADRRRAETADYRTAAVQDS
jgi:hypothetical protein